MRRYETIVLVDADISDELLTMISDKLKNLVNQDENSLIKIEDWGVKKLAYEIKKRTSARYIKYDFYTNNNIINKFEHFLKINDNVLKYMTVLIDRKININDNLDEQEQKKEVENVTSEEIENETDINNAKLIKNKEDKNEQE